MKKVMMMGAATMLAGLAFSQSDSVHTAVLDEVTITATRMAQKQSTTGKVVTVISKAEIEKKAARTLGQLLNEQAGITVNGALSNAGSAQSLYMRGASTGRTLVLLDGIPVYDPSLINGEFDLNLISLNDAERIEICRGAQSTLYGSDAIAGVINIITAKPDSAKAFNLRATAIGGNYGTFKGNAQVFGATKGLTYTARYGKVKTDGFSAAYDSTGKGDFDNDGYNGDIASASVGYAFNKHLSAKTFVQYSGYKSDIDAASFKDENDFRIENKSLMAGAIVNYQADNFQLTGKYQYSDITRNYFNDSLDTPGFNKFETNDYFGKNQFVELYGSYALGSHFKMLHGADYRYSSMNNRYYSTSNWAPPYESVFPDASVNQASVYTSVLFNGLNNKLHIELGGRFNSHSKYGNNFTYTFNPSYSITDHFRIFGSIASGFKAPTLYHLYAAYAGDPNLKPEKSTNYEIGIQHQHKIISTRLVYFYRDIKDGLDYNYVADKYFNFVRQKVQGLEFEAIIKPIEKLTIKANYTLLTSDESTQSRQNFKDTSYTYLLRRPKHSLNINAGYQPLKALYVSIGARYASDRFDTGGYMQPDVKLDSYFILNAYAEYGFNKYLKIFADAQNLTDKKFFEVNGYNAIPFMISGGITFTL